MDNGELTVRGPHFRTSRTLLMGILNVTPDSFSDGGRYLDADLAIARGLQMVEDGADLVDIGGESTRPGAPPVSEAEELRRVMPVIEGLVARIEVPVSIDTQKPGVARLCVAEGAAIINDVSGFRNPAMMEVASECGASVVLMHMRGTPETMQLDTEYSDVVAEVGRYLEERAIAAAQGAAS